MATLIIERLDGCEELAFMTKGHHSLVEFEQAIARDYAWLIEPPRHVYMRKRPDPTGECSWICEEAEPGRGAFPATFAFARSFMH